MTLVFLLASSSLNSEVLLQVASRVTSSHLSQGYRVSRAVNLTSQMAKRGFAPFGKGSGVG